MFRQAHVSSEVEDWRYQEKSTWMSICGAGGCQSLAIKVESAVSGENFMFAPLAVADEDSTSKTAESAAAAPTLAVSMMRSAGRMVTSCPHEAAHVNQYFVPQGPWGKEMS